MSRKKSGSRTYTADDRQNLIEKARLAEQAERFDDMAAFMREVVRSGRELSAEERHLLAEAYKKHVGVKRAAWRIISTIEQRLDGGHRRRDIIREYRRKIENEMRKTCNELLNLVETHLIITLDVENKVFYLKMKGDYYRYLAEFCREDEETDVFENAKRAYDEGLELAKENLTPAHPLRLGLILNFSVFYFEIMNAYELACDMARDCVAQAQDDLKNVVEESRADSAVIMQLLRDNVKIWTNDMSEQGLVRVR